MLPAWAEEKTDLRRWTIFPKGGHFAPAEIPIADPRIGILPRPPLRAEHDASQRSSTRPAAAVTSASAPGANGEMSIS